MGGDQLKASEAELRNNPRVNALLVALRKIRDRAPTLEAAQTIATIAIEEYIKSGGCDVSGVRR